MRGDMMIPTLRGRYWHWPDGTTLPVVSGGSDDGTGGGPPPAPVGHHSNPKPAPNGGDLPFIVDGRPGTQADVDRIIQDRVARVKTGPPADYDDLKAKAAKLAELEAAGQSDYDKAIADATKEATDTATKAERAKSDARIVRAEVKALAGTKLQDPTDAVRLLDLTAFKVDDDGNVDEKAITAALDDLLKTKPYLAANAGKGNGKMPNLGQGDRGTTNTEPSVQSGRDLYRERHPKRGGTTTT